MLLTEVNANSPVWILVDPEATPEKLHKGTKVTYTYDDGDVCSGWKSRSKIDQLWKLESQTKSGYFSLAWNEHNIWVIFHTKTWKTANPMPKNDLHEIQKYASGHDVPKKFLSSKFIRHYTA